jgi:gamma-glutamyltranspeptidase/glutathione hydrolase
LKDGQPFMALGTPGGDNQDQTILQAFLNIVEFWPNWYPNLHEAFEWPRVQTLHFLCVPLASRDRFQSAKHRVLSS